jgi:hypothetical protein
MHSQTDAVSALDGASTGTEPDLHDRSDRTAHAAAVAQREEGAVAGEQRTLGTRTEARQRLTASDQQRSDATAKVHGHVAAVRDRDEHEPRIAPPLDTKTAECEAAQDAPGHDHPDADPEAHLHVDAITAQRACRQEDEDIMVARFGASRRPYSERHDRALTRAER